MPPAKRPRKPKIVPDEVSKAGNEIHVLNGPNLDMLGYLEPELYGSETLSQLERKLELAAKETDNNVRLRFFQTNHEGEMLEYLHALVLGMSEKGHLAGVVINLGGWTHTSIALRDAVQMLRPVPLVEVQFVNPEQREEFRKFSVIEDLVDYRVIGMGSHGYVEGLRWLLTEMKRERLDVH